jgi:hypothetical protein
VGTLKGAIVEFVTDVTTPGSAELGAGEERIAVFDNDGTLWVEKPIYTQLAFAIDRVEALAPVPQASESFVDSIVGVRIGSGLFENC